MVLPAALLLLADSRLPSGAHAHSGGLAAAVTAGTVTDEDSLAAFLRGSAGDGRPGRGGRRRPGGSARAGPGPDRRR